MRILAQDPPYVSSDGAVTQGPFIAGTALGNNEGDSESNGSGVSYRYRHSNQTATTHPMIPTIQSHCHSGGGYRTVAGGTSSSQRGSRAGDGVGFGCSGADDRRHPFLKVVTQAPFSRDRGPGCRRPRDSGPTSAALQLAGGR